MLFPCVFIGGNNAKSGGISKQRNTKAGTKSSHLTQTKQRKEAANKALIYAGLQLLKTPYLQPFAGIRFILI